MLATRRGPALLPLLVSVSLAVFAPAFAAVVGSLASELDGTARDATGETALVYTVQVGAFATRANAASVLAELRRIPADGAIAVSQADGKTVYRVLSGTFATEVSAQEHGRVLATHGFRTYVRRTSAADLMARGSGSSESVAPTSAAVHEQPAPAVETAELAAAPVAPPRTTATRPAADPGESGDSRARALKLLVDSIESGRRSALAAGLSDDPAR